MKQINMIHLSPSHANEQPVGDMLKKVQGTIHSEGRLLTMQNPLEKQEMLRVSAIMFGTIVSLVALFQLF